MKAFLLAALALTASGNVPPVSATVQSQAAATGSRSLIEPSAASWVNARQAYLWSDGAVYRAWTEAGMITDIALQPGEALIAVAAGDTARWIIGDTTSGNGTQKRTHVLVKPFSAGLRTNLIITTDRRTYHLQLESRARGGMSAVSWNYPLDALVAVKPAASDADARGGNAEFRAEMLNFGYTISGDKPAWRPERAFDDGRQTFIEFPASIAVSEAPPLFLIDAEGQPELVNYRMQGRFYIVDRLFRIAELRLGTKKQRIVRIVRDRAAGGMQ